MGDMLLMYQNTTMRVYGAQIKRYCVLCSKHIAIQVVLSKLPAGSRQAAWWRPYLWDWSIEFMMTISIAIYTHVTGVHHDDVITWKHFPRYWPFVMGNHRSSVDSPHKCQWRGALKFSLICTWTNGWANNRAVGDLRRHRAHYEVIVMFCGIPLLLYYQIFNIMVPVLKFSLIRFSQLRADSTSGNYHVYLFSIYDSKVPTNDRIRYKSQWLAYSPICFLTHCPSGRCCSNFTSMIFKLITRNVILGTRCEIVVKWMQHNLTDEKLTLL